MDQHQQRMERAFDALAGQLEASARWLRSHPFYDDPLDRARSRLMRPSTPEEVATAALDGIGSGPVTYTHPDDAFVASACFALPRDEATLVWRQLQETSSHAPERIAK